MNAVHGVGHQLHGDRGEQQTGDPGDQDGARSRPSTRWMTFGEPHRQVEAQVHGDDAERDGHPVGDGLVGLLDEDHRRDDGAGAGQQRRAQRHERDVDLAVARRLRLLHLARSAAPSRRAAAAARRTPAAPAARCACS